MDLIVNLNTAQQQAVKTTEGPVLVLAGPGSGKTRVLINRVGYLVRDNHVPPWQIMAVTFTRKAAQEMKDRLLHQDILSTNQVQSITVGTFHSICARILRQDIGLLKNYHQDFVIYDTDDQLNIVKSVLGTENIDPKRYSPRKMHSHISESKRDLVTPEKYTPENYFHKVVKQVYIGYEKKMQENNALDYDDLLMKTHQLFSKFPDVLARYQKRYEYVLVDEFQDTNTVQYELVKMISGEYHNLFCVGDEDQSIYSWRGADFRNVLRFRDEFPNVKTILLGQNYRSTQNILAAASAIIVHNKARYEKDLFTNREQGCPIIRVEKYDAEEEAQFVISEIEQLERNEKIKPADVAIMYRVNAQSREIEEAFIRAGMPYRLIRGTRFYERREIKDAIAYLRLIHNPNDSIALQRIINVPPRRIGIKTIKSLIYWAGKIEKSTWEALIYLHDIEDKKMQVNHPFGTRAKKGVLKFIDLMQFLMEQKEKLSLIELFDLIFDRSGYKNYLLDGTEEGEGRWENLQELKTVAQSYSNLADSDGLALFLEEVALVADTDALSDESKGPSLLTLHSAKGLEFPVVFMVGMEDGILPHSRSRGNPDAMEEERRLVYVGITRAKDRLYLIHTFRRNLYGRSEPTFPSPFLDDIPDELIERTTKKKQKKHASRIKIVRSDDSSYENQTKWQESNADELSPENNESFQVGDIIQHHKFGKGKVISVGKLEDEKQVTVKFTESGVKRLLTRFAKLKKVSM